MTMISSETLRGPGRSARAGRSFHAAVEAVLNWYTRSRERRQLASLNEWMLHDIGVTRADVEREYSKPFWRA